MPPKRKKWDGLCAAGLHGLDLEGQPCDLCAKRLVEVHARLFPDDFETLKRRAEENGVSLQIELRQLVRRALKGERREVLVLKEQS